MSARTSFTMSTMFRLANQQIKTQYCSVSTLVHNESLSNKVLDENKLRKKFKHLLIRNMNSVQKQDSELKGNNSSKQPYTIVVEGNIGSGKVRLINIEISDQYKLKVLDS